MSSGPLLCSSRFQEKFGMAADVYGEQGMEQVKAADSRDDAWNFPSELVASL